MTKIQEIQKILGVVQDDIWGPKSQAALDAEIDKRKGKVYVGKASSFADPKDIEAFKRCKRTGKTDKQCFAVGDNGIGQFGANTAQTHTPMCALHATQMVKDFGSIAKAAHNKMKVTANGKTVVCLVEDRMSAPGRVDLNPAAAKVLGLKPPFLVNATWQKA